jgi:TonB-linked SusC/RagA family outer membrane protein
MRKFKISFMVILLAIISSAAFAQVSGKVSTDDGKVAKNATVKVKGTSISVQTDDNGNFNISEAVAEGAQIEISLAGYVTRLLRKRGNVVITTIAKDNSKNDEIVVTAFGIGKQSRSLGFATQGVKGEEIAETQRDNWMNAITGRVAGATVNATSGAPGASSQIVLRGFNSVGGDNSALIVVDGVIFNNGVLNQGRLASDQPNRGNDYTNRGADINPDDIEKIDILKGPEAAALYGVEAGNGAIVITTKKGKVQKVKVSYDNSFRFEALTRFHDVQKVYDNGAAGLFTNTSRLFMGPKYTPGTKLYNNVENFFEIGKTAKHNLSLDGGKGLSTYRGSLNYFDQSGIIPTTGNQRINARVTVVTKPSKRIEITNSAAYFYQFNRKAGRGLNGYYQTLLTWPMDDDARKYLNVAGTRRIISKAGGVDNLAELNNPYFEVNRNKNFDRNNRVNYNFNLKFKANSWLNFDYRFGADMYSQYGATLRDRESSEVNSVFGRIEEYTLRYKGFASNLIATAEKKVGKFKMKLLVGQSIDDRTTTSYSIQADSLSSTFASTNIKYKDIQVEGNTSTLRRINSRTQGRDTLTLQRSLGAFFDFGVNYKDLVYVNVTGRNDWLAEFPIQNRSFFYPAVSGSFIFSDLVPKNKIFTYGKLRASHAQTGKRLAPYANQSVYTSAVGSTNGYGLSYGFGASNPNIFPEQQKTTEIGTELQFFNNKLSFDVAYYQTNIFNSVPANARPSYATGFILYTANIADVENKGIEVTAKAKIINKKNFTWNTTVNFAKTNNKVVKMPLPEFYNSDSWLAGYRASLFRGLPTTTIGGQNYLKNNKGDILIDPGTGNPLTDPNYTNIGDRNPDFVMGFVNSFKFRNLNLSFTLDYKHGGDVLNGTEQYLVQQGLSLRTLDREKTIVIKGVLNDGLQNTNNPTVNTIPINPYFDGVLGGYYNARTYAVDFVEKDVNWLRLRDVTLRYTFGKKLLNRLKILQSGSLFVTGTDLFILTNYTGIDPAVNGNTPATGGVGGFAIDLLNTPTPISVNFGIAVSFKNGK